MTVSRLVRKHYNGVAMRSFTCGEISGDCGETVQFGLSDSFISEVSRSHTNRHTLLVGVLWTSDHLVAEAADYATKNTIQNTLSGIRTHDPSNLAAADPRLRQQGDQDRLGLLLLLLLVVVVAVIQLTELLKWFSLYIERLFNSLFVLSVLITWAGLPRAFGVDRKVLNIFYFNKLTHFSFRSHIMFPCTFFLLSGKDCLKNISIGVTEIKKKTILQVRFLSIETGIRP